MSVRVSEAQRKKYRELFKILFLKHISIHQPMADTRCDILAFFSN